MIYKKDGDDFPKVSAYFKKIAIIFFLTSFTDKIN